MTDKQLASFVSAAQWGSFSKAAANSYISVPAFAQQIRLLEKEMGMALFNRSSKGVTLTRAGEAFLPFARAMLANLSEGLSEAKAAIGCRNVRVSFNAVEPLPSFVAEIARRFKMTNPDSPVEYVASAYDSWIDDVAACRSDVCFFMPPDYLPVDLEFVPLYKDRIVCCVRPASPLAAKSAIGLADLQGETVYLDESHGGNSSFSGLFDEATARATGFVLDREPFTMQEVTEILMKGGVLPTPERYASSCVPLVPVPLVEGFIAQGVVARKNRSEAVDGFIAVARSFFINESA